MKSLVNKYLIFIFLPIVISCENSQKIKETDGRIINYKIDYLAEEVAGIPTHILPHQMELIFAGKHAKNTIKGFMGQFELSYIADRKAKTVITLLRIFDKKYYYKGKNGEMPVGLDDMKGYALVEGYEKRNIAGFEARELILKLPGKKDLSLFVTDMINIQTPNITTPYHGLDDVFLKFYTSLSNMEMVLTAEGYREEKISTEIFFIPEGFRKVSRTTMEMTIAELFK